MRNILVTVGCACALILGVGVSHANARTILNTDCDDRICIGALDTDTPADPVKKVVHIEALILRIAGAGDITMGSDMHDRGSRSHNRLRKAKSRHFHDGSRRWSDADDDVLVAPLGFISVFVTVTLVWQINVSDVFQLPASSGQFVSSLSAGSSPTANAVPDAVPDGGTTMSLLGLSMLGLGALGISFQRRRFA